MFCFLLRQLLKLQKNSGILLKTENIIREIQFVNVCSVQVRNTYYMCVYRQVSWPAGHITILLPVVRATERSASAPSPQQDGGGGGGRGDVGQKNLNPDHVPSGGPKNVCTFFNFWVTFPAKDNTRGSFHPYKTV